MLWLFAYLLGLIAKKATRSNQKFGLIIIRLVISRMGERKEGLPKKSRLKAGLCYDKDGASVCLRGTVEIINDVNIRREKWQDWYINHFPGGPADPNYVLLRFVGAEATIWIDHEFAHIQI